MNYKILQVLATLMSKTSFDRDSLNRFKPGGLNQGGQNLPTLCCSIYMVVKLLMLSGMSLGSQRKQGNSVARDLPRTGSETNTTIFVIYILDIDSHCPYLLSGETTFQLTSCFVMLKIA